MDLLFFKTLWGLSGSYADAARAAGFAGLEGPSRPSPSYPRIGAPVADLRDFNVNVAGVVRRAFEAW